MRVLVLQHIAVEHPGVFRDFLAEDRIPWDAVELDQGERIPPLAGYDMLWVMGGPMDTWQVVAHPWFEAERRVIREAVRARAMPVLGVCLGAQLLAEAVGGEVGAMAAPEIGILDMELTAQGRHDPLLAGLDDRIETLQWHSYEVTRLPPDGRVLAQSPDCARQVFAVGATVYGIQGHVELTAQTVPEWGAVPEYGAALEAALGPGALARLEAETSRRLADFNRTARRLYDNFMALAGGAHAAAS
jgi:GMP synthase-like glutamine amidotransferase